MEQQLVTYVNGKTVVADVIPADIVAFERRYGASMEQIETVLQEHALFLPFASLSRQGRTGRLVFEQWITKVASVSSAEE